MELAVAPRSAQRSAPFREKNRRGECRRGGELTSAKNGGEEGSNRRVECGKSHGVLRRRSLRLQRIPRESESGNRGEMQAGRGLGCGCCSKGARSGQRGRTSEWEQERFRHPATERDGCRRWVMTSGPRLAVRERKGKRGGFLFFQTNFQSFFQMEYEFKTLLLKTTLHKNKMLQHECINMFLNLY